MGRRWINDGRAEFSGYGIFAAFSPPPLGAPDLRHAPYRLEGKYLPKALKKLTIEDHIEITVSDGMLAIFAYDYGQVAICKTKARKLIEFLIAKLPELQDEPG
jgi:hypothetical protein